MNTVTLNCSEQLIQEFSDLFKSTSNVRRRYMFELHENATPVVQAARRVTLALRDPIPGESRRVELAGIVAKLSEPTDWVSSLPILSKTTTKSKGFACIQGS